MLQVVVLLVLGGSVASASNFTASTRVKMDPSGLEYSDCREEAAAGPVSCTDLRGFYDPSLGVASVRASSSAYGFSGFPGAPPPSARAFIDASCSHVIVCLGSSASAEAMFTLAIYGSSGFGTVGLDLLGFGSAFDGHGHRTDLTYLGGAQNLVLYRFQYGVPFVLTLYAVAIGSEGVFSESQELRGVSVLKGQDFSELSMLPDEDGIFLAEVPEPQASLLMICSLIVFVTRRQLGPLS